MFPYYGNDESRVCELQIPMDKYQTTDIIFSREHHTHSERQQFRLIKKIETKKGHDLFQLNIGLVQRRQEAS